MPCADARLMLSHAPERADLATSNSFESNVKLAVIGVRFIRREEYVFVVSCPLPPTGHSILLRSGIRHLHSRERVRPTK